MGLAPAPREEGGRGGREGKGGKGSAARPPPERIPSPTAESPACVRAMLHALARDDRTAAEGGAVTAALPGSTDYIPGIEVVKLINDGGEDDGWVENRKGLVLTLINWNAVEVGQKRAVLAI